MLCCGVGKIIAGRQEPNNINSFVSNKYWAAWLDTHKYIIHHHQSLCVININIGGITTLIYQTNTLVSIILWHCIFPTENSDTLWWCIAMAKVKRCKNRT